MGAVSNSTLIGDEVLLDELRIGHAQLLQVQG